MKDNNLPIINDDELREINALIGDENSSEDISLDEIMMEFGGAEKKSEKQRKPAENPVNADQTTNVKLPESSDELENIISEVNGTSDKLPDTAHLPHIEAKRAVNEEQEIQERISNQVKTAMNKKQMTNANIPKSVAENSAVQVTEEFEQVSSKKVKRISAQAKTVRENVTDEENYGYDISDDLKTFQKLMPLEAMEKAKSAVSYYMWRCIATAILTLVSCYITAAPTYSLPLPGFISYMKLPYLYLLILAIMQIMAMLISVSLIADGIRNIPKFNFKSETLIAVFSFVCLFHTISIMLFPKWGGYLPYTSVAVLSMFIGELSRFMRYSAVRSALRAISKKDSKYAIIKGMKDGAGKVRTIYKTPPAAIDKTIMSMIMEEDGSERVMRFYVPFILVLGFIFAITASFGTGNSHRFLWCYSAILSISVPAGAILSYVFPYKTVSARLSSSGSVVAGNRGAKYMYETDAAVLNDSDIFPAKMVAVTGAKTYGGFTPEKTSLYTMSMLKASGSGLYDIFCYYLHRQGGGGLPVVENFEFFENGGLGAYVNGEKVLVGSASFIMRSGIRIPEGVNSKNSIFIAVNMQLAGHFTLKYDSQPSVRRALNYFVHRKVVPVIAARDFNITPSMLETKFKLNPDKFGYPELEERIAYSGLKDSSEDEVCGAIAVDNMSNYSDVVSSARRIHTAYKINVILGWICVILGMPIVFYLLFTNSPSSVTPFNIICYIILWLLPVVFTSVGANRR